MEAKIDKTDTETDKKTQQTKRHSKQKRKEKYLLQPLSLNPKLKRQPLKSFQSLAMITVKARKLHRKWMAQKEKISGQ